MIPLNPEYKLKFKGAVIRHDLQRKIDGKTIDLNDYCKAYSKELMRQKFIPVSGAGLMNDYWQLYVIRVNTAESKLLYVGSTKYTRGIRFLRHTIRFKSANIFNEHKPFGLDNELFDASKRYIDQATAEKAEKKLADELQRRQFKVEQS